MLRTHTMGSRGLSTCLKVIVTLFVVLTGCRSNTITSTNSQTSEALASVNGFTITRQAFEKQMNEVAAYRSSRLFTDEQKRLLLLDMINFELVLQEANKSKFYLENDTVRKAIVSEYLKERVNNQSIPTDQEIAAFYAKNQTTFDSVCARHILVSTQKRDADAASKRVQNLLQRLAKGEDFLIMADAETDDIGSRGFGGDVGCFNRKKEFVPEFIAGAFSLKKVGDYTNPPVKSQFGYHIIMLTRDLRGKEANYEVIKKQLTIEKNKNLYDNYMNGLREAAKAEIHFEKLTDINLQVDVSPKTTSGP